MNIWNWIVASSADPKKTSLLIKGFMVIGSGYVLNGVEMLCRFAQQCLPIDQTLLTQLIDNATDVVFYIMLAIGAVMAAIGAARKIYFRVLEILAWWNAA